VEQFESECALLLLEHDQVVAANNQHVAARIERQVRRLHDAVARIVAACKLSVADHLHVRQLLLLVREAAHDGQVEVALVKEQVRQVVVPSCLEIWQLDHCLLYLNLLLPVLDENSQLFDFA